MKTLFTSLFLIVFTVSGFAQGQRGERIKAMKTAFITEQLELTSSEAEKFWPVYNKFESELHTLKRQEREQLRSIYGESVENINDAQAKEILIKLSENSAKEIKLQRDREQELLKIISPSKVLKLRKAEHDFQMQLLRRYRGGNKK